MGTIVVKCFKTKDCFYVYDRHTNAVIRVAESEYADFLDLEKGTKQADQVKSLPKYQKDGFFQPNTIQKIEHPETGALKYLANHQLLYFVLQVTQQCNLRCAYCAYSGNYTNRTHANKKMSFDTAKKAIEFMRDRSRDSKTVSLGFYGGEPLLEFDLIKNCVGYFESVFKGKERRYSMTTNATLLNDETIDFLAKCNFSLLVSLDGTKEEHDKSRKYASGKGTFDDIMKNLQRIREKYPSYFEKKVSFNTVLSSKVDVNKIENFFMYDTVVKDANFSFAEVSSINLLTTEYTDFSDNYTSFRRYNYLKVLLNMLNKIPKEKTSVIEKNTRINLEKKYKALKNGAPLSEGFHHGGPCIPGVRRLFIDVDGNFYPCEKVEEKPCFIMGNLTDGFNLEKMNGFLNIGRLTEPECMNCWCARFCMMCVSQIELDGNGCLSRENKLKECGYQKQMANSELTEYAVMCELGYKLPKFFYQDDQEGANDENSMPYAKH